MKDSAKLKPTSSGIKLHIIVILIVLLFIPSAMWAQNRSTGINNQNISNKSNFYSIQKRVYAHLDSLNADEDGYYMKNGKKQKIYGYKQFKRWEWFWQFRIDPVTGEFPLTTAEDIRNSLPSSSGNRGFDRWTVLGPSTSDGGYHGIGRINCIVFRPGDTDVIYAGSPSGGLWKSTDGGTNWTALTDQNAVLGVSHAQVFAGTTTASDTIYIATGDRDRGAIDNLDWGYIADNHSLGVLKSVDGGTTWTTTGLSFAGSDKETTNRIIVNPDNHNVIYVSTSDGLYKSYNAGTSFTKIYSEEFVDLEMNTSDTSTIYGGTRVGGKIFVSFDEGSNWAEKVDVVGGYRTELAVTEDDPNRIYAVITDNDKGLQEIRRSIDGGISFSIIYEHPHAGNANQNILNKSCWPGPVNGGQGDYDLAIAVDPNDADILFVGGINTWKSTNGGVSFSLVNHWNDDCGGTVDSVHADKHCLAFQNSSSILFEGNDGGIYSTSDGGGSWTDLTNGMVISQFYRIGVGQVSAGEIIGGLQDNGSKLLSGTWSDVLTADGLDCAIDYITNDIQYGSKQGGWLYRTTNHWSSSTYLGDFGSQWLTPILIDPNVHNTIYIGDNSQLKKSLNSGNTTSTIGNTTQIGFDDITCMAVADANSNYIYVGKSDEVFKTTDGGTNWTDVTGTLPITSSLVSCLTISNVSPDTAWAAMGEYDAYSVFQTVDGGTTWTDISSGLPNIPVMCVIQNRQNTMENELYAATDVGVYQKTGTSDWILYSSGLPNVVVTELEIYYDGSNPASSRLIAATWGRGVWESALPSPPPAPPVADFSADEINPVINDMVSFTDLSTESPTSWLWTVTPSTVTYVGGTTQTSQNPQMQFTATGLYTISLYAENAIGNDTETKSDYINVSTIVYCSADGGTSNTTSYEYISGVEIGTINNTGTGADEYSDYTAISTSVTIGEAQSITITIARWYSGDDIGVWIDWNQDGDFDDADENVVCETNAQGTFSFTPPGHALIGETRMRVRLKYSNTNCGYSCGHTSYGEVEDYTVDVQAAPITWTGSTSSDWATSTNWSGVSVPSATDNVIIPETPIGGVFPIIGVVTTDATCNNLTLENGATLEVRGRLAVNGTSD